MTGPVALPVQPGRILVAEAFPAAAYTSYKRGGGYDLSNLASAVIPVTSLLRYLAYFAIGDYNKKQD